MARGEMAEWPNAPVLKTGSRASGTGVRIPLSPPFSYSAIFHDITPRRRVLDVQDGIRLRAQRTEDYFGGGYGAQILRQDRDERGLGIGDARKRSILRGIFGIRAGRACGPAKRGTGRACHAGGVAAARHGDRRGQPFRTERRLVLRSLGEGGGRLRRSTARPPELKTGYAASAFVLAPVGPTLRRTSVTTPRHHLRADIGGNIFP